MEKLRERHIKRINNVGMNFIRSYINEFPWNERLIGIKGSRGVGKTTLLLQYIKKTYQLSEKAIYISLDDLYFTEHKLIDFVDTFVKNGGTHIFIDEVHKYDNWAIEIKNIYDIYEELKIVFTGSSLLEINKASVDLSRRALIFEMQGLSFREFLELKYHYKFNTIDLNEIITNHLIIASEIILKIKPFQYFSEYLQIGYYPFFQQEKDFYYQRLREVINMIIEIELPLLRKIEVSKINKIKQLLYIIAQSVPFKPNISSLSAKTSISRNTMVEYIKNLDDSNLIQTINKNTFGVSQLQKPEKIYLENTNLAYAITYKEPNIGNIRETFFYNQLKKKYKLTYPDKGDFMVDNKYVFEVGGQNKTSKQISNIKNAFIVADGIEYGIKNKIPLWLFGMLY